MPGLFLTATELLSVERNIPDTEMIFRFANEEDCGLILSFIRQLAAYEKMSDQVVATEDLCVLPEYRGKGYGKALLKKLAQITVERGCGRLEWTCLDWKQPSIDFYRSLGAVPMDDWTTYRLSGDTLLEMVK